MKRVLITGTFRFPDKDAAAFRVYSIAKLFGTDYTVHVAGWEKNYNGQNKYIFDNLYCFSQGDLDYNKTNLFVNLFRSFFRGINTFCWIIKIKKYDLIILYNPPSIFSILIILVSSLFRIKLILDSTEWYESKHLSKHFLSFARFENAFRMFFVYKLFKNVICISDFLKNYYKKNSIVIPPLFLESKINHNNKNMVKNETINFLYAGQMGQKDSLKQFIYLLPEIAKVNNINLKLIILGMSGKELKNHLSDDKFYNKSSKFVDCLGRVDKKIVSEYYKSSHFVVFFRENKRYAIAGFPSKSVEAWQHGLPIITNEVGELKKYLIDNCNSIIIDYNTDNILSISSKLISIIDNNLYPTMVEKSFKTFEDNFSVKIYTQKFNYFINNLN